MISSLLKYFNLLYKNLKEFRRHFVVIAILQVFVAISDLIAMTLISFSVILIFTDSSALNFENFVFKFLRKLPLGEAHLLDVLVIFTICFLLLRVFLGVLQVYYSSWIGRSVLLDFTTKINEKILCSSYRDITTRTSGELALLLGDESYTVGQTVIDLAEMCSTTVILVLYFIVIGYISIFYQTMLIFTLALIGSSALIIIKIGKRYGELLIKQSKMLHSAAFDLINNMKAIRLFNNEESEIRNYETLTSTYRDLHVYKDLFVELTTFIPVLILYGILVLMYFFVFYKNIGNHVYNSSLALILFGYTSRVFVVSKSFASKCSLIISNIQSGTDVFSMLNVPENEFHRRKDSILPSFSGKVEFNQVSYQHLGQTYPLFHKFDLCIPLERHMAIVGETGSGKSTLLDLLIGLLNPKSGKILVSGQDLNQINQKAWRSKVIYVNQEISLFNDTILKNLTYGASNKNMEKVIFYSKLSLCHEFITALPAGYETVLHYQGKNISGGQKQRLLIAHALICEPEVLILDESTSSLDEYTQGIIMNNIKKLYENKTLIVVTHKSEMFALFDHIIRLDKGKVAYQGDFKGYQEIYRSKVSS